MDMPNAKFAGAPVAVVMEAPKPAAVTFSGSLTIAAEDPFRAHPAPFLSADEAALKIEAAAAKGGGIAAVNAELAATLETVNKERDLEVMALAYLRCVEGAGAPTCSTTTASELKVL